MMLTDVPFYRLYNQRLAGSKLQTPAEVVRWLGAVQAQDYHGALWSVGLRMRQATETTVEQALTARKIIRTWPMRGTLHFVAPEDVRWMLKLLATRVIGRFAGYYRQAGLTPAIFAKSKELFALALRDGNQLTRKQMYQTLEQARIPTREMRGLFIVGRLAMEGFLVFGARQGKQQTFALLEEWLPPARILDGDEALAELAKRYFRSHGPATLQDFMWWSGLTTTEARIGIELAKRSLRQEVIDDRTYWRSPATPGTRDPSATAYFLQGYDEFGIAYKDRSAVFAPQDLKRAIAKNMVFGPSIVIDGRGVAFWKRTLKKDALMITISPFRALSKSERQAIAKAADQYAAFLGLPAKITTGS
jgi:hypothetical protein